jgi:hypothetical protein
MYYNHLVLFFSRVNLNNYFWAINTMGEKLVITKTEAAATAAWLIEFYHLTKNVSAAEAFRIITELNKQLSATEKLNKAVRTALFAQLSAKGGRPKSYLSGRNNEENPEKLRDGAPHHKRPKKVGRIRNKLTVKG